VLAALIAGLVTTMVLISKMSGNSSKKLLRVMHERGELGPLPREVGVELTDDGVFFTSVIADDLIRWAHVQSVEETGTYVVFVLNPLLGYGVPLRAFARPQDAAEFAHRSRQLMQQAKARR